jgi:hypothetical protein
MNGEFEKRLRTAVRAAWCTIIGGVVMMTATWLGSLWIMHAQPDWIRTMWGGQSLTWDQMQTTILWFFSIFKLILWTAMLGALFLTLWARNLKKAA